MSGVHVFDPALQEANLWLKGVMERLVTDDVHVAQLALKSTLHALRDRIGPEPAVHLGAQLPTIVRGIYYEGWRLAGAPTKERHLRQFLDHVAWGLPPALQPQALRMARAVFDLLGEKLDSGEIAKVIKVLPAELRELWEPAALPV